MYNVLEELLYLFPAKRWCSFLLSTNENMNESVISNPLFKDKICIYALSYNKNISLDFILKNYNLDWFWYWISERDDITIDLILKYPDKYWNWNVLSKHPNIQFQDILMNPQFAWNYPHVSLNPNLTIQIVRENMNVFRWDWYFLSKNKAFTI